MKINSPYIIPIKLGLVKSFIVKGKKKTVIVDTGYPGNADKILRCLYKNQIRPEDISLIVLTHAHIDHYGSAEELRAKTGTPIAVHRADAEHLKKGVNYIGKPMGLSGYMLKTLFIKTDESVSNKLIADIVFDDEADLYEFGIAGKVIHTPGHTAGSVSLFLSGGQAIVGDLLMGGIIFQKRPAYPLFANDLQRLQESIMKVIQYSPKLIYAAHGGPFLYSKIQKIL